MAKDLRISFLLDFYGDMLTDTQREVVDAYYNEDLSLAEIAQDRDITRQDVRDAIKRAEQQLLEMEERLGLARRFQEVQKALTLICDCAWALQGFTGEDGRVPGIDENAGKSLECGQENYMEALRPFYEKSVPAPPGAFHILYSRRESQWHSRVWRKSLAIPLKSCAARASSPRRT